jgi:hypothetical protein
MQGDGKATIPVCNGFNTGNCVEADQVKSVPRRGEDDVTRQIEIAQVYSRGGPPPNPTGPILKICEGITNTSDRIEPKDMRSPHNRANAKDNLAQEPTGNNRSINICNGTNSSDCVEPDQVKEIPVFGHDEVTRQTDLHSEKPNPTGEIVKICDGISNSHDCIEPNDMKDVSTRPNARAHPIPATIINAQGNDLPICNGENGILGTDCRAAKLAQTYLEICNGMNQGHCIESHEMKARAEGLIQYYLPTCTDRQQEDCQPVCTES